MNWENIKTKYPKAWIKLEKYFAISIDQDEEWKFGRLINEWCAADDSIYRCAFENRTLYDFFDEQGVLITISLYHYSETILGWHYEIGDEDGFCLDDHSSEIYKSRTEAEEKAFGKAFEILENKLEGGK